MFNPLSILTLIPQLYGVEYAAAGVLAFGVSLLVYMAVHAGKVNF